MKHKIIQTDIEKHHNNFQGSNKTDQSYEK